MIVRVNLDLGDYPLRYLLLVVMLSLGACEPSAQRPGILINGESAAFEHDWSFTDEFSEISIQVRTPYLLPHAITIWCGSVDGELYLAAGAPDSKRWPGWVATDPHVGLRIGNKRYDVVLQLLQDGEILRRVQKAYAVKYKFPEPPPEATPTSRYWHVLPDLGLTQE